MMSGCAARDERGQMVGETFDVLTEMVVMDSRYLLAYELADVLRQHIPGG